MLYKNLRDLRLIFWIFAPARSLFVRLGVAAAAQLSEDKVKVVCIDTPHEGSVELKPRIYNVKISGGQVSGDDDFEISRAQRCVKNDQEFAQAQNAIDC